MEKSSKGIFFLALTISVSFHIVFLFCLQFSGLYNVQNEKALSKEQERDYLQTVFSKILKQKNTLEKQELLPKPFAEAMHKPQEDFLSLKSPPEKKERIQELLKAIDLDKSHYINKRISPASDCSFEKKKVTAFFDDFSKKVEILPVKKNLPTSSPSKIQESENKILTAKTPNTYKTKEQYVFNPLNPFQSNPTAELKRAKQMTPEKGKIDIQRKKSGFIKLMDLKTKSCAEDFDIDVSYTLRDDGKGYLFAITLIPKPFVQFPKLKQNFFFILDRSNAIGKKRLHITQSAILRALANLSEIDTFNILAFDNRVELFSPYNVSFGKKNFAKAKRFLDDLSLGNIFTSSNITLPLYSVLSYPAKEDDINVAILLTNGDGAATAFNNRKIIDEWSYQNNGKISLYSMVLDTDEEKFMMKMFSAFNRGKSISSNSMRGIKRKLLKLMGGIKHPIAKDVVLSALSDDGKKSIELYSQLKAPHIYFHEPYVILGSIDTLDDFTLFIQAKQNDKYLNIKKRISFANASTATKSIKREWAMQKAFEQYGLFVQYNDPRYLQAMRGYLTPYDIKISF